MADDKGTGGAGENGGSADDSTDDQVIDNGGAGGNKQVSYETHKKLLAEAKAAKARAKELEAQLSAAANDKLAAEGNKDKLIEKYKSDFETISKKHKDTLNGFIGASLDAQVREAAGAMGCVDADAVCKLLDMSDFEVDTTNFKADKTAIGEALAELKKAKPYLFQKAAPKVNSKVPTGAKVVGGKSLKEMSTDEIKAQLSQMK